MRPLKLRIEGMSCGHCVARVEKALLRLDGVALGQVKIGYAELFYDPSRTTLEALRAAIDDAGYSAQALEPSSVPA